MIVPFWSDVDTRRGGTVNYRETTDRPFLLKASEEIRRGFPSLNNINLGWAFVVTWDDVAFYGASATCDGLTKRNTFQAILTTDGSKSFVIFFYNKVTWTTGTASSGNCTGLGGIPAKAGFDTGDGTTFFEIGGACTDAILNIETTTNVGQPGKWIFRIDNELQSAGCLSSAQAALEQLTISPSFMSIFGNNPITVKGPCIDDATLVQCRFNDITPKTVNALVSSDNVATCIVPYLYKNGRISVDLLVTRTVGIIETFSGFIYTIKPNNQLRFSLAGTTDFTMSWDKSNFGGGDATQLLDLELVEFVGGVWTSRGVIKENVLNTGSFLGPFNSQGLIAMRNLRNIYVVKLGPSPPLGRSFALNTNSIVSDILYSLVDKTQAEIDNLCYSWYIQDPGAPTDAEPCPPTLAQASVDARFEVVDDLLPYNPGAEQGYRQRVPSASGAGQRCTYINGQIVVGPPSGGNVRSVSPNGEFGVTLHAVKDILPWYTCCQLNTNPNSCRLYYERRPSSSGEGYRPNTPGQTSGDPHIYTFDGFHYLFNGVGEFWMIKADSFSMQARLEYYYSTSVSTAFVMQQRNCQDNLTIQVSLTLNGIEIIIDGDVVAFEYEPNQPKRTIMHNGASIAIFSPWDIRITFSSGYTFAFSYASVLINLVATASVESKGKTNGLLGFFDGSRSNDLTLPNGEVVYTNATQQEIHDFAMQWRITAENSLFTYPRGKTYNDYQNVNFVPDYVAPTNPNVSSQAVSDCRGSEECLFDLFITGNADFARSTLETIENYNRSLEALNTVVGVCERPIAPENGYLEAVNYLVGSTARVVCNENLQVNGNGILTCVTDSLGRPSWNGVFGGCIVNICANENAWLQFLCEMGLAR